MSPFRKKKKRKPKFLKDPIELYWAFLVIIFLIAGYLILQVRIFQNPASLKIESLYSQFNVMVEGEEQTQTPYQSSTIQSGEIKFVLSKESSFYKDLERKITLTPGKESVVRWELGPVQSFSGGEIVSNQMGSPGLSVVSNPDKAKVFLDGEEKGEAPLLLSDLSSGLHELSLEKDGYLSRKIVLQIQKDYSTQVSVQLFAIPLPSEEVEIKEEPLSGLPQVNLVRRHNWNCDEGLSDQDKNQLTPVKKIVFYNLSVPEAPFGLEAKDWVKGIYYYTIAHEGWSDVPFHYFIDTQGNIYEGKRGGCESFPQKEGQEIEKACRVAYLGKFGEGVSTEASEAFGRLQSTATNPFYQAEAPSVDSSELDPQTQKSFVLEFKNIGEANWYKSGERAVYLKPESEESDFYTPNEWEAQDRIGGLDNDWVLSGWGATINLTVTAPSATGEYEEKFSLYHKDGEGWTKIDGSETTIKIKVVGESINMVRIKETGTGFLNVRSEPGFSGGIIDTVKPGKTYPFLEEQGSWTKIKYEEDKEGWVSSTYVEKL